MTKNQAPDVYEVLTYTLCDGWVNCWTVTEDNGEEVPDTFDSYEDAEAEVLEFLSDIEDEIKNGERSKDEGYSSEDFRISKIRTS